MNKNIFIAFLLIVILTLFVAMFWGPDKVEAPLPDEETVAVVAQVEYSNATSDNIVVDLPKPGDLIQSPVTVTGRARGTWYFEASFPIMVLDSNGNVIGQGPAQAIGEWMTEDFVPFSTEIVFTGNPTGNGFLLIKNDNPSGLPQFDKSIKIPVTFSQ